MAINRTQSIAAAQVLIAAALVKAGASQNDADEEALDIARKIVGRMLTITIPFSEAIAAAWTKASFDAMVCGTGYVLFTPEDAIRLDPSTVKIAPPLTPPAASEEDAS